MYHSVGTKREFVFSGSGLCHNTASSHDTYSSSKERSTGREKEAHRCCQQNYFFIHQPSMHIGHKKGTLFGPPSSYAPDSGKSSIHLDLIAEKC